MLTLIGVGIAIAATVLGYRFARRFVRGRLRYVDAVQKRRAPLISAAATTIVLLPVVGLLPVIGAGTALLVGAAVGAGVAAGARDVREPQY